MGIFAAIELAVVGEIEVVYRLPSTGLREIKVFHAYENCTSSVKVVFWRPHWV